MSKMARNIIRRVGKSMLTVGRVLVFLMVLFLYLHVHYHLKTSDDLEVYEVEAPSKDSLEEVCGLRQPVRLAFDGGKLLQRLNEADSSYAAFDVKVRDALVVPDEDEELSTPFQLGRASKLLSNDKGARYVTEGNAEFLAETGLAKVFRECDPFLRPPMVATCRYDLMAGSAGAHTPFRYDHSYRMYIVPARGTIKVRLSPPKSRRYLYPVSDYCNYEFRTPVNPWKPQPQYAADFAKSKCLDVEIGPGQALYVPARWWYSVKYETGEARVAVLRYGTYMSHVATCPHSLLWALQSQNVRHRLALRAPIGTASTVGVPQIRSSPPTVSTQDGRVLQEGRGDGPADSNEKGPDEKAIEGPTALVAPTALPVSAAAP